MHSTSRRPSRSSAEAPGVAATADVAKHVWFTQVMLLPHCSGRKLATGLLQKLLLLLFPSSFPSSQLHASTACCEGRPAAA